MALDTAKRKQVVYSVGDEIENTIAKGFRTLFVVGTRDPKEIMDLAEHIIANTFTLVQVKVMTEMKKIPRL